MRAVVTGCAGFIGSHLVAALLDEGHEVVGIDALTDNYAPRAKLGNLAGALGRPGFTFHRTDLACDPVASLLDGAGTVFHLAGEPGVRTSFGAGALRHHRHNVVATRRLLATVRPGARLVYASSSSVHAGGSPYAQSKAAAEQLCLDAHGRRGVDVVVLRPFTVYGPRQRPDMAIARFIAAARAGAPLPVHGDGSQERDFTYVGDVVDALLAAGRAWMAGGRVLDVGAGRPLPLRAVLEAVSTLAGRPLAIAYGAEQPGDARLTCADPEPAADLLGWRAGTSFADGLAAQWAAASAATPLAA